MSIFNLVNIFIVSDLALASSFPNSSARIISSLHPDNNIHILQDWWRFRYFHIFPLSVRLFNLLAFGIVTHYCCHRPNRFVINIFCSMIKTMWKFFKFLLSSSVNSLKTVSVWFQSPNLQPIESQIALQRQSLKYEDLISSI